MLSPDHERLSADYDPVGIIVKAMPQRQDWQTVRPGMQTMSIRLQRQDRTFAITAWRLDPEAFEFRIVTGGDDGSTAAKLREENQSVLAIDAGFFEHDRLLDIRKLVGWQILETAKVSDH